MDSQLEGLSSWQRIRFAVPHLDGERFALTPAQAQALKRLATTEDGLYELENPRQTATYNTLLALGLARREERLLYRLTLRGLLVVRAMDEQDAVQKTAQRRRTS